MISLFAVIQRTDQVYFSLSATKLTFGVPVFVGLAVVILRILQGCDLRRA
jgi:hypothetical protein